MSDYYLIRENADKTITVSKWDYGKQPARVYTLRPDKYIKWSCDCPAGYHHRMCKHAQMVEQWIKDGKPDGGSHHS